MTRMGGVDLKERRHRILEAIILSYAETGMPVGSEFLLGRHPFGVSSATIRNVMSDLEEEGLISHPHTSAGRVPTDLGYRYYVDLLMGRGRLAPSDQERIDVISGMREEPTEVLREAARALSELTEEAGVALVPRLSHGSFGHLELIGVEGGRVVAVLISAEGMVRHTRLELGRELEAGGLRELEELVNAALEGLSLTEAHAELGRLDLELMAPLFEEEASVILEGASWILRAPEFRDIERTRRLMRGLEDKSELAGILLRDLSAGEVKLHIGSENRGTALTDCTIAGAPYRLRGGVMGTIGVVGPTRMNYPRITELVGRTAEAVTRALGEEGW